MSGGGYVWAILMIGLVAAYLMNMRSSGIGGARMFKMAGIWVVIIIGCYLIVSAVTGE